MRVPTVRAIALVHEFSSGKTRPCAFACEGPGEESAGEYVVKFGTKVTGGSIGLASELVVAQLAMSLGLNVPAPAVVELDLQLANAITNGGVSQVVRENLGLNFGGQLVTPNASVPSGATSFSPLQRISAAAIVAFDGLIDNADRRRSNPNLLRRKDDLFVLDHELAFAFRRSIGGTCVPITYESLEFLRDHPLYEGLRGRRVDLDRFQNALANLDTRRLRETLDDSPWPIEADVREAILDRIAWGVENSSQFVQIVRRVLA